MAPGGVRAVGDAEEVVDPAQDVAADLAVLRVGDGDVLADDEGGSVVFRGRAVDPQRRMRSSPPSEGQPGRPRAHGLEESTSAWFHGAPPDRARIVLPASAAVDAGRFA